MAFTFFFRDAQTLELLIEQALPTLCGQAFIRIWDAGCAHGPEAYTLAMLLRERMSDYVFRNVRIHATDVEAQFWPAHRRRYLYRAGSHANRRPRFGIAISNRPMQPGFVQVTDDIRATVSFAEHDLLSLTPPREDFSLVVCKNVLLHFDKAQRHQVFCMFHRSLRPGGLLATEHTQKLPEELDALFEPVASYAQVFRRLDALESSPPDRRIASAEACIGTDSRSLCTS